MRLKALAFAAMLVGSAGLLGGCLAAAVVGGAAKVAGTAVGVTAKGVGMAAHGVGAAVGAVAGGGKKAPDEAREDVRP